MTSPSKGRDPLSVLTYLTRNVRRILPASIMLASAVIIVVVVLSMLRGVKAGAMRYTREFRVFTVVLPKKQATISKEERAAIRSHPAVERVTTAKAFDESRAIDEVNESFDQIMFMTQIISVLIMLVVALVVGLLNNIFFAQRIDEFAVLLALGWRRGRLVRKVLGESLVIAFASWLGGLGLALGLMEAITWLLLEPRGIFIPVLHGPPIGLSLLLPAVAMVFSGVTVFRRLTTLDPIVIIERRG